MQVPIWSPEKYRTGIESHQDRHDLKNAPLLCVPEMEAGGVSHRKLWSHHPWETTACLGGRQLRKNLGTRSRVPSSEQVQHCRLPQTSLRQEHHIGTRCLVHGSQEAEQEISTKRMGPGTRHRSQVTPP